MEKQYESISIQNAEIKEYQTEENDVEPKELELPPVAYRTKEEN